MDGPAKLGLVDARGHEFTGRLLEALLRFAPTLRRDFPALSTDDANLADMLETVGEKILARLSEIDDVKSIERYTWAALQNLARSKMRRLCHRIRHVSTDRPRGRSMLDILQAPRGTPGQIESGIFMREIAARFTPDEQKVENLHAQGFKLKEIAATLGCPLETVQTLHRHALMKARLVSQIREPGSQRRSAQPKGQAPSVKAATARTAGVNPDNGERQAG